MGFDPGSYCCSKRVPERKRDYDSHPNGEIGSATTIPMSAGFGAIEEVMAEAVKTFEDFEWYYGNVYEEDGRTPLGNCSLTVYRPDEAGALALVTYGAVDHLEASDAEPTHEEPPGTRSRTAAGERS